MKILVPIDGSPASARTVREAARLAKHHDAHVILMHVVTPKKVPEEFKEYVTVERFDRSAQGLFLELTGEQILSRFAVPLMEEKVSYEKLVVDGSPSEKILNAAEHMEVDMIVMGLTGLHGIGRVRALGSISRAVMERAKVPVMMVPE